LSTDALLIAVIGVSGTLAATWLTQWSNDRTRGRELAHAEQQRRAAHDEQAHLAMLTARRTAYVALNAAARQYLTALRNRAHAWESTTGSNRGADLLEEQRASYRNCYAEAQMIVPDAVLTAARAANAELNQIYGTLRRLEQGSARDGDSLASVRSRVETARALLHGLRDAMRADLKVTETS
jgi:type II secretory pathway pseudopilin PulG